MKSRIYLQWSGCNRRKLEIELVRQYLISNGYTIVDTPAKSDKIIYSSCAFKKKEEDFSINQIRNLYSKFGDKIIVLGCLPNIAPNKFKQNFPTIPNAAPRNIELIENWFPPMNKSFSEIYNSFESKQNNNNLLKRMYRRIIQNDIKPTDLPFLAKKGIGILIETYLLKQKVFYISVGTGCMGRCSYCRIRYAIGPTKSRSLDAICNELKSKLQERATKIIFISDDIGSWGIDIGSSFPELIEAIGKELDKYDSIGSHKKAIIQFNELHPKWLIEYQDKIPDLINRYTFQSLLIPIQLGNDIILKLMDREHNTRDLGIALEKLRQHSRSLEINTQIIVGFPTEERHEFQETLHFISDQNFNSVVVFPYHDKEKSIASRISGKIDESEKTFRVNKSRKYFRQHSIKSYLSCPD